MTHEEFENVSYLWTGIDASTFWGTTPSYKEMKLAILLSWLTKPGVKSGRCQCFLMGTLEMAIDRQPFSWPRVLAFPQKHNHITACSQRWCRSICSSQTQPSRKAGEGRRGIGNISPMAVTHLKCPLTVLSILALVDFKKNCCFKKFYLFVYA